MSNVDEATLLHLEQSVDDIIRDDDRVAPRELAVAVVRLRRWVDELLRGHQHPRQRERLYCIAVRLSGVLGAFAMDLAQWPVARAYCLEAYQLAELLASAHLQAWARANQSLVEYYAGNYHDALGYAIDGQRHANGGPQSVRLALNGEARALARLGDVNGVHEAVERGYNSMGRFPRVQGVSASLTSGVYCAARAAGNAATAYLLLGQPQRVDEYADQALAEFDSAGLRGPQALTRMDQAMALLLGPSPDPEAASGLVVEALEVSMRGSQPVVQRVAEFVRAGSRWRELPQVQEVVERVRKGVGP
jgi:tetratricopeptide (TPR) repeat protein